MKIHNDINEALKAISFTPQGVNLQTVSGTPIPDKKAVFTPQGYCATVGSDHDLTSFNQVVSDFPRLAQSLGYSFQRCLTWNNSGAFRMEFSCDLKIAGETFRLSLFISSSIDGSCRTRIGVSFTRLICTNGMGEKLISGFSFAKRTKGFKENWESRTAIIASQIENAATAKEAVYQKLAAKEVSRKEARELISVLVTGKRETEGLSTRSMNTIETVEHNFTSGFGNRGVSRLDILNGYTQFLTHDRTFRETARTAEENRELFLSNELPGIVTKAENLLLN